MESRTYYYARVSSKDQNLARQISAFKQLGASDRDIITAYIPNTDKFEADLKTRRQ